MNHLARIQRARARLVDRVPTPREVLLILDDILDVLEQHTHEVSVRLDNSDFRSGDAGTGRTETLS